MSIGDLHVNWKAVRIAESKVQLSIRLLGTQHPTLGKPKGLLKAISLYSTVHANERRRRRNDPRRLQMGERVEHTLTNNSAIQNFHKNGALERPDCDSGT